MKLTELVRIYTFHDAGVNNIQYFSEERKLLMDVVLTNYGQPFSQEDLRDVVPVRLIFTGVSSYTIDVNSYSFDEDEILSHGVFPSEREGKERWDLVLDAIHFPEQSREIKLVSIEAEDVTVSIF